MSLHLFLKNEETKGDVTLKLQKETFNIVTQTERLVIRPLTKQDYENWFNEFNNRYPSQNRHNQGKVDMSECDF